VTPMKILFTIFSFIFLLAGCGDDGYKHVGANGVDATPRNLSALGPKIHLQAGTVLIAAAMVSENATEYLVKSGYYEGNYVVIQNRDLP